MSRLAVVVMLLLAGCAAPQAADCKVRAAVCVGLAFASLHADASPEPPAPKKCCGECGKNGLPPGKVLSGDKLKIVACGPTTCGCPADCPCKQPRAACANGVCR